MEISGDFHQMLNFTKKKKKMPKKVVLLSPPWKFLKVDLHVVGNVYQY